MEQVESINQSKGVTNKQIERHKKEQEDSKVFLEEIEQAKETISRITNEIDALKERLPANISDDEDIQSFQSIGENLNMRDISVNTQDEVDEGFYIIKRYEFKARATYLQFLLFFEKIANLQRIFNTQYLRLELPDEESRGVSNWSMALPSLRPIGTTYAMRVTMRAIMREMGRLKNEKIHTYWCGCIFVFFHRKNNGKYWTELF